ncbi:hypothetical protein [Polaromonas sp. YR568]|uniref:hypothetical protein n=1 Tax=Polaromonas sp. YR568 TaxID=1855301 RepID=UPI0031377260
MSDGVKIALLTAVLNGAVTWGVVSTKLEWLRRDVDRIDVRLEVVEERNRSAQK